MEIDLLREMGRAVMARRSFIGMQGGGLTGQVVDHLLG
jgi:hypothetical protein